MAKKGQRFKSYSFETKLQAVRMRMEGKTKREIAAELEIVDKDHIKKWMRQYREHGESALIDKRGRKQKSYTDQERYIKKLEMENAILKKWIQITKEEV